MIDFGFFREIFQSINKNKLRTLLSGFTVAFAIMLFLYFLEEPLRLLRGCR